MGGQASWLLPAALVALVAGAVGDAPRAAHRPHARRADPLGRLAARDRRRLQLLAGHHPHLLRGRARAGDRRARRDRRRRGVAAPRRDRARACSPPPSSALTGAWSYMLLDRTPAFEPWLRPVVLAATAVAARRSGSCAPRSRRSRRRATLVALAAARSPAFAGEPPTRCRPSRRAHTGSIPSAGPTRRRRRRSAFGGAGRRGAFRRRAAPAALGRTAGAPPGGPSAPGAQLRAALRGVPARGPARSAAAAAASASVSQRARPRARVATPAPTAGSPRPSGSTSAAALRARDRRRSGDGDRRLQRQRRRAQPRPVHPLRPRRRDPLLHRLRRRRRPGRRRPLERDRGWVSRTSAPARSAASTVYDLTAQTTRRA